MTNTPKDKTPSEIAKELWISNSYCHCMDSAPCSTDKPCDYCLTIIAEIEATIAAERQNRCPQCEAGNKPWWDYAWMHTINGANIDCRGRYPDPRTPHGKDFYEEITEQNMKIASLEAELAEARKANYRDNNYLTGKEKDLTAETERQAERITALEGALRLLKPSLYELEHATPKEKCYRVVVSAEIESYANVFDVLASPTKEPDPSKEPCPEDCDYEATHGYCPYKDHGTPHPPKGDSAGPEKKFTAFEVEQIIRNAVEIDWTSGEYVLILPQILEALDRAEGKGRKGA